MNAGLALPGAAPRREPGMMRAVALSAAVHLLFVLMLVFGVRWQNRAPVAIAVELWDQPVPPTPAQLPPPAPQPAPKAAAKPEPRLAKPDIAVKVRPEKKKEAKEKEAPKARPDPRKAAEAQKEDLERQFRDELAREDANLSAQKQDAELRELLARQASPARAKEMADYVGRIRAKVRGYWFLPPNIDGNPEAVFLVTQLPTGEVVSVQLVKSSGNAQLDLAIERAIIKSQPLPLPSRGELFQRELKLTFRPRD